MKRKTFAILAFILVLAMAIPMVGFAASNETTLNKLKLSGVADYDKPLPKGGTVKKLAQINALKSKIKFKPQGKGTTWYSCYLYFGRLMSDAPGTYQSAEKSKSWSKMQNKNAPYRGESTDLKDPKRPVFCYLATQTNTNYYDYSWDKGATTGSLYIQKKKSNSGGGNSGYKESNYRVYADESPLGEKCFVYSFDWKDKNGKGTRYYWISRKTGIEVKWVSVDAASGYMSTLISFVDKKINKAASFYKKPTGIKFKTVKSLSAGKSLTPETNEKWLQLAS